jgi:DNA-binding NtrC family response regulator
MLRLKSLQDDLALQNQLLEEQNQRLHTERARGADLELALRACSRVNVLHELGGGLPDGIVIVDGEGIIRWSDRGARDIFGGDLEGRGVGRVAPDTGLEAFVRDARTDPREAYRFELSARSGRSARSFSASVVPLVPTAVPGESAIKIVLLIDARKRRIAGELLALDEHGPPRSELGMLIEAARERFHPSRLIGKSAATRQLRAELALIAAGTEPVLVRGEPGTGKSFAARILHFSGPGSGPLMPVWCAASPQALEGDLFGRVKAGSDDGQRERPGLFQQAQHGTIYLREVSALPYDLQAKVLRAIRDHEVSRVGSHVAEPIDARVIASSSQDLEVLAQRGAFHPELHQRLSAAQVLLPPLRERKEDVKPLCEHFLRRFAPDREGLELSHEALWTMEAYAWPGNVRELEACIERAAGTRGDVIEISDLALSLQDLHRRLEEEKVIPSTPPSRAGRASGPAAEAHARGAERMDEPDGPISLQLYEKKALLRALRECNYDKRAAAHMLGIGKSTFYRKLNAHGLSE